MHSTTQVALKLRRVQHPPEFSFGIRESYQQEEAMGEEVSGYTGQSRLKLPFRTSVQKASEW